MMRCIPKERRAGSGEGGRGQGAGGKGARGQGGKGAGGGLGVLGVLRGFEKVLDGLRQPSKPS